MLRFWLNNKGLIGICVGILVLIFVIGISNSLWFLRGFWGSEEGVTEFGYHNTQVLSSFFAGEKAPIVDAADQQLGFGHNEFYSLVYVQDGAQEYITGIPRVSKQFVAASILQSTGWTPHRVGWIILGNRERKDEGEVRSYGITKALKAFTKATLVKRLPMSPVLVVRTQAGERPIAFHTTYSKGTMHVVASNDSFEFVGGTAIQRKGEESTEKGLFVALPSYMLSLINQEFLLTLESSIAQSLHFEKTTPSLLTSIPFGKGIYLGMQHEDIAIGTEEAGDAFTTKISERMNAEQGNRHPSKKAFSLPDRTIGYEYVPGAANVRFNASESSASTCLPSEGYDEKLFLCGTQEAAILASREDTGKQLLTFMEAMKGNWGGYIPGEYPITLRGDDKRLDAWIQVSK
jgi:hypothetical protein